ncbi:MAG: ABC transporter substrate-binding protein [Anaerolineales bacterium]|nr:ABC transporter substrate-binding protein [Anaerolineales bacterium]MBP6210088.1 ABC transporter substrate-binding protein [Anaerolineales bacterium]MBP8164205.1 ABC transporter substrate-binding protein [Anaerolineales bacterium]
MNKFKLLSLLVLVALMLGACGGKATEAPSAPEAPAATEAPAEAPAATEAPASNLPEVAREDTVVLGWSISSPIGVTNPWAVPGYTHQEGNVFMWEPLMYFSIFADEPLPWLADSMDYTKDDFTELTIKLNKDAAWSDGTPVTSKDVAFTFEGQLNNEKLPYHASFVQFVDSVATPDDATVVVTFKIPAPRFAFEVLMLKFDTGIPIVPAHVLENEADVNAFAGGLDMVHSGPYNLVQWDANQKIYDLREDWWAVKAGRIAMPQVKRIVMVNIGGQVGQNMDIVIQRLVNNEFDAILDVRSSVAKQILDSNDKITTHTGSESPYGYLDWWPNSLWMNTQIEPFSDVRVRRAISLAVNRDQIDELLYEGAKVTTIYPFPLYPGLQKFVDSPEVKALEEQYQPRKFDLEESAALMTEAGFTLNGDGLWEKDGATVPAVINGFEGIHADIVTVLVEMLRTAGFDADINFGSDAYNNMADGKPGLYMFGHGASLKDPYAALELYHSKFSSAVGTTAGNNRFSRYVNPEYDALLDEMAPLSSDDPRFQELAAQALGIYWRDQIDVPIIQWLHRIPYNQTYWTNWPTADNLAMGTNGAFWAQTGLLVITGLEKAK